MNKCLNVANNYLKNIGNFDKSEVITFIDNFNNKIEEYSANGLSSFVLECVEVCLELCVTYEYTEGEVRIRFLKGNLLVLGGQYKNALKSFNRALGKIDTGHKLYTDIKAAAVLVLIYIGQIEDAVNIVGSLLGMENCCDLNFLLSIILKYRYEDELSLELLNRCKVHSNMENLQRVNRLVDLDAVDEAWNLLSGFRTMLADDNDFLVGYTHSIDLLISAKKGLPFDLELIPSVEKQLKFKKSFYHYIAGLINLAEVYFIIGDIDNAFLMLNKAVESRKDLKALDIKIYKLMEELAIAIGDFKKAHDYNSIVSTILKETNSFAISKALRSMSDYLYQGECVVS